MLAALCGCVYLPCRGGILLGSPPSPGCTQINCAPVDHLAITCLLFKLGPDLYPLTECCLTVVVAMSPLCRCVSVNLRLHVFLSVPSRVQRGVCYLVEILFQRLRASWTWMDLDSQNLPSIGFCIHIYTSTVNKLTEFSLLRRHSCIWSYKTGKV